MADQEPLAVLKTVRDGLSAHITKLRLYGILSAELENVANLRNLVNQEITRLEAPEPAPAPSAPTTAEPQPNAVVTTPPAQPTAEPTAPAPSIPTVSSKVSSDACIRRY